MHIIQCKQKKTSAPFEEPILKNQEKKTKYKRPFFAGTPILGSYLTILINFFLRNEK